MLCARSAPTQPRPLRDPKALPFGYIPPEGIRKTPPPVPEAETPAEPGPEPKDADADKAKTKDQGRRRTAAGREGETGRGAEGRRAAQVSDGAAGGSG